jgi:addiction module HigA family antidote
MGDKRLGGVGAILYKDFMKPNGLTAITLADALKVQPARIHNILVGHRKITTESALRLEKFFGKPAEFWLAEQAKVELAIERPLNKDILKKISPMKTATKASKERKTAKKNEGK